MTLDDVKAEIQSSICDGAVTVVGSGLSAGVGLPSMTSLAEALLRDMPGTAPVDEWAPIAERLEHGADLEAALDPVDANSAVLADVISYVGKCVREAEGTVLDEMVRGTLALPFGQLVARLARVNTRTVVVTTNYDRLVEAATELAGFGVDTSFVGSYCGAFDPVSSQLAFASAPQRRPQRPQLTWQKHVALFKPHGSLDWYSVNDEPIRSLLDLAAPRLLITPGRAKYRAGYERPFDHHRDAANRAITNARRLLLIGYGFNDDHLQTHLRTQLKTGTPGLVLARRLTDAAARHVAAHPALLALERGPLGGTRVHWRAETEDFADVDLWDLGQLIREALE